MGKSDEALTRGMENSPQRLTMQGVMEVEGRTVVAAVVVVVELLDMMKYPFFECVVDDEDL